MNILLCSSEPSHCQGGQKSDDNFQLLQDIMVHSKMDFYKPEMLHYTHEVDGRCSNTLWSVIYPKASLPGVPGAVWECPL